MKLRVRAHFDGRVFVPDERVELPVDHEVVVETCDAAGHDVDVRADVRERNEALLRFLSQPNHGQGLPDWALEREYMYDDRA